MSELDFSVLTDNGRYCNADEEMNLPLFLQAMKNQVSILPRRTCIKMNLHLMPDNECFIAMQASPHDHFWLCLAVLHVSIVELECW